MEQFGSVRKARLHEACRRARVSESPLCHLYTNTCVPQRPGEQRNAPPESPAGIDVLGAHRNKKHRKSHMMPSNVLLKRHRDLMERREQADAGSRKFVRY